MKSVDRLLSFHLRAGFSITSIRSEPMSRTSESNAGETAQPVKYGVLMNILYTGVIYNVQMIVSTLREIHSQTADHEVDSNVLNNLYRSIQLLPNAHPNRSQFLAEVGEIYVTRFRHAQCKDDLNKAVIIFQEAMSSARLNDNVCGELRQCTAGSL